MHTYVKRIGARSLALAAASICFAFAGATVLVPAAAADPINAKDSGSLTLACSNGQSYTVVTNSGNSHAPNGVFVPAFDVNSTTVFVPSQFLAGTVTFTGPVDDTLIVPAGAPKGNSQGAGDNPVTCSFSSSNTFELTSNVTLADGVTLTPGSYAVTVLGQVEGFIPSQK